MVITIKSLGSRFNARRAQLQDKALRAGDAAKHYRTAGNILRNDAPAHPPNQLSFYWERLPRGTAGKNDDIGASQRGKRFAQPSSGKQLVASVFGCHQHDVKVALEGAVLKAVIQQVQLGTELALSQDASLVTILAHNHGNTQTAGDQQRLVAEITG